MTNFTEALQEKMDELEEEKERIDEKIELLQELMDGEGGKQAKRVGKALAAKSRKAGRPKGAKNKKTAISKHAPKDELYDEAMQQVAKLDEGGTSPELQQKRIASFNPTARPHNRTPKNVHAGTKKTVDALREEVVPADTTISVDESDLDD